MRLWGHQIAKVIKKKTRERKITAKLQHIIPFALLSQNSTDWVRLMIDTYILKFWRLESSKSGFQGHWWLVRPALPIWELLLFYGRKERGQWRVPHSLIGFQAFVLIYSPPKALVSSYLCTRSSVSTWMREGDITIQVKRDGSKDAERNSDHLGKRAFR